jgi:hypothetical protein
MESSYAATPTHAYPTPKCQAASTYRLAEFGERLASRRTSGRLLRDHMRSGTWVSLRYRKPVLLRRWKMQLPYFMPTREQNSPVNFNHLEARGGITV